jgi:hypothetical protein
VLCRARLTRHVFLVTGHKSQPVSADGRAGAVLRRCGTRLDPSGSLSEARRARDAWIPVVSPVVRERGATGIDSVLAKSLAVGNLDSSAWGSADEFEPEVGVLMTERGTVASVVFRAPKLLNEALRCKRVGIWCGITFELTGPLRRDGLARVGKMYRVPQAGPRRPAVVGPVVQRGVMPHPQLEDEVRFDWLH